MAEEHNDNFDATFDKVDSGASLTFPLSISDVKKGTHICMGENRPCKVMEITTSKTGKHGHAKANITGIDIFNGKKYTDVCPVSHSKDAPNINRTEYTVMAVDDEGYVSMIDKQGNVKSDLKLPNDVEDDEVISKRILDGLENGRTVLVTVLSAMGIEKIEDAKEAQDN
jgi:translation initiation factor 5A